MSKCKCRNPILVHKGEEIWCSQCYKRVLAIRKTWSMNPKTRIQENKKKNKKYNYKEDLDE